MESDWRVDNAISLKGQPLRFKQWTKWSKEWDHDHCAGCWATFAEYDGPDVLKEGYATTNEYQNGENYCWVCKSCFSELQDVLEWYEVP